ncbi:MAG: hypothetical protein FWD58_07675, partial [Firmicutes bacterium]|nr:hypothetical protein [Bacillota bacterium]
GVATPVCADCGEHAGVWPPVCADCGEEPCVCPSVCAECGENPCVCPPVCADCGEEPCVCPPSPEEPTFISSAGELSAPVKNGWYVLSADLTLPADVTLGDFSGIFDGRGHTLEAEGFGPLFHTLTGELKNLNYVATGGQEAFTEPVSGESPHAGSSASIAAAGLPTFSVDDDFAFICIENRGLISDISVTVSSRIEASLNPESDKIGVFISAVAAINSGTIKNCTVLCDLEVKNTGTKECMIGTFAGENTGTVSDCVTQPLSRIAGDTADTGGIVFDNLAGGKVQNCINNASLSQVTPSADWNPHIGGIVLYNVGRIEECRNMGDILIEATYAGNQQRFIRVGGIATMNVGYIAKSKSVGQIGVSAGTHEIQAGGIAGISNAVIEACGFEGGFDVQKSAQNGIVAVGGIVGWYVSGILRNNFALFSAEVNRAETAYVGGILGVTELMSLPLFENWYYSSAPVVEFGIASAYTNGFFDAYKGFRGFIRGADVQDSNAVMRAASEEELKALAVYF